MYRDCIGTVSDRRKNTAGIMPGTIDRAELIPDRRNDPERLRTVSAPIVSRYQIAPTVSRRLYHGSKYRSITPERSAEKAMNRSSSPPSHRIQLGRLPRISLKNPVSHKRGLTSPFCDFCGFRIFCFLRLLPFAPINSPFPSQLHLIYLRSISRICENRVLSFFFAFHIIEFAKLNYFAHDFRTILRSVKQFLIALFTPFRSRSAPIFNFLIHRQP